MVGAPGKEHGDADRRDPRQEQGRDKQAEHAQRKPDAEEVVAPAFGALFVHANEGGPVVGRTHQQDQQGKDEKSLVHPNLRSGDDENGEGEGIEQPTAQ